MFSFSESHNYIHAIFFHCSAGLHASARANSEVVNEPNPIFEKLLEKIQSPTFSNITKMASEERIDDLENPLKMRKMQQVAVVDLTKTDPLRKKVDY